MPGGGWAQIVAFLGTYELFLNKPVAFLIYSDLFCKGVAYASPRPEVGDEPGNYGKGNLGLGFLGPVQDPEARKKKLSAELANGRLAMMAIIGMHLDAALV